MATREEVVITKNGRPVVLLRTVEEKEFALASKEKKGGRKRGKR
jgi:antitoxin (DNA-binding transcriptional repressor) of toxin-antitoxin stability system